MRKFKNWKMLTSAALVGASALTLAACSGGSGSGSTTAATTTASQGSGTTTAAASTQSSGDASDLSNRLVYAGEGTDSINPILSCGKL